MSFTSTAVLGEDRRPAHPYEFAKQIEQCQPKHLSGKHQILFNKGRYFETTIYCPEVLRNLCALTGFKAQYGNMIGESWKDMEDFVIAMNILGYYITIDIDWI